MSNDTVQQQSKTLQDIMLEASQSLYPFCRLGSSDMNKEFEPNDDYRAKRDKLKRRLARIHAKSDDQLERSAINAYLLSQKYYNREVCSNQERFRWIKQSLDVLYTWQPATEAVEQFRQQMISSYQKELDRCVKASEYMQKPVRLSGAAWKAQTVEELEREIKLYDELYEGEVENTRFCNEWVQDIRITCPSDVIEWSNYIP